MRRRGVAVLAAAFVPALVAIPTITGPAPAPHPVAGSMQTASLSGLLSAAPRIAGAAPPARSLDQTSPFDAVAVSWAHRPMPSQVTVSVRVRAGGRWSGWQVLTTQDSGPDATSPEGARQLRDGTEPLWTGPADGVQVRLDGVRGPAPSDLRLDLINPGSSSADAHVGSPAPAGSAAAAASEPAIYTRAQWGADESLRKCFSGYSPTVQVEFVHHTDTSNSYTAAEVPAIIRSIYYYHVVDNGWCDIGYNYLIDRFGRIWEGRWGGIGKPVLGAQAGGFNTDSFGTALIGTFTSVSPPAAMVAALDRLGAWELGLYHRDPAGSEVLTAAPFSGARYRPGTRVRFRTISGHRDADFTDCPGAAAYALLPAIRTTSRAELGTGLLDPSVSATEIPPGSPVTVSLSVLQPQDYKFVVYGPGSQILHEVTGYASGPFHVTWNGTTPQGSPVTPGEYSLVVDGWNTHGSAVPVTFPLKVSEPAPSAVATGTDSGELFYVGPGGQLLYRSFTTSATAAPTYGAPASLGGKVAGSPAAVQLANGTLAVFVRGTDQQLFGRWQTGSGWSAWTRYGGVLAAAPAALPLPSGAARVFADGVNGNVYYTTVAGSFRTPWVNLGGYTYLTPGVATAAGAEEVYAIDSANDVVYAGRLAARWGGYHAIGWRTNAAPGAAAPAGASQLALLLRAPADAAMTSATLNLATGAWSALSVEGGTLGSGPAAAAWPSGHLEAFMAGTDGKVYEDAADAGTWSGWRYAFTPGVN